MELLKLLNLNEVIVQVLAFLLLLFLLRAFAWKKILHLLDERKNRISSDFDKIEQAKKEISELKAEYGSKLNSIEETTARKMQEAIAEGRKITEEIRKKANEEAQDIIEKARNNIKHELASAKEELKEKVVDLTIKATEQLIREKFTDEDDTRLIKDFLGKIDQVQ